MILQALIDTAEICARHRVRQAVISPGSRNAPLTLAFARHPDINCYVVPDERSAGFIALGMARKSGQTVVLICTSGTAVYNFAPAVAEAYFSQVPLVIFSADRPPEWIDQRDGQTIRQRDLFHNHVRGSFTYPDHTDHPDQLWHAQRLTNDAVNLASGLPNGPVHINVPLREPFYPKKNEVFKGSDSLRIARSSVPGTNLTSDQVQYFRQKVAGNRVLIVACQGVWTKKFINQLNEYTTGSGIPVISDVISNCGSIPNAILGQDLFLAGENDERDRALRPDLLITFGQSVISKNLKLFLRNSKPAEHWHIDPCNEVADTFQSMTQIIRQQPSEFLAQFPALEISGDREYLKNWKAYDQKARSVIEDHTTQEFWELMAVGALLKDLPPNTQLHLANSMPVRWANVINLTRGDITVFANRGTSGIDGCLSTAVGCALAGQEPVVAILGDMSFIYDRNGLWHNHIPGNLRIVVLNNRGGGIFRLIDGPSDLPELDEYFETRQQLTAANTVKDFEIDYLSAHSTSDLTAMIKEFFIMDGSAKLLEIHTDSKINKRLFNQMKADIKQKLNK